MEKASAEDLIGAVRDGGRELRAAEADLVRAVFAGEPGRLGGAEVSAGVLRRLCLHAGMVSGGQPGRICISGGTITGKLLDLTGLRLDFGLQFTDVRLPRLVLRDTRLLALELLGGSAAGIEADRIEVGHDILMTDGFTCNGRLRLRSASVGGDLNCDGSRFLVEGDASIVLDGTRIGGRLYLRRKKLKSGVTFDFQASHGVYGRNMRVAGGVICSGGIFDREVDLTRTQVQSDVRFDGAEIAKMPSKVGGEPDGELRLGSMLIEGELSLDGTNFHGPDVVLSRTRVERSIRWEIERTPPVSSTLGVDLMQAHVGYLHDDLDNWHDATIRLDGFSFDGVAVREYDWLEKRTQWLDSQPKGKWSPFPYGQMRIALQSSGYEGAAREISVAREKARLHKGRLSPLAWLAQCIYGGLLGYGYKPFRFFVISAIIVAAFAAFFSTIQVCGTNEPAASCSGFAFPAAHAPVYHSLLYSLDAFTPVDLGQTGAWTPNGVGYAFAVAAETALGWVFAALLIGAATGILRRD